MFSLSSSLSDDGGPPARRTGSQAKEFGKAKLYMASQENSEELSLEEMKAREEAVAERQRESQELRAKVTELETEMRQLSSHVTVAELAEKAKALEKEVGRPDAEAHQLLSD